MDNTPVTELKTRMKKAIAALKEDLAGVRASRASTSLLEPIVVDLYGSKMPIKQVASLSVPDARAIVVQPWDKGSASAIEKAIRESDLGLNPIRDGHTLRIPLPELTEERRKDLVKLTHKYSEQTKVVLRNLRRDANDQLKKMEKNKEISQDELRQQEKVIQEATDQHVREVDQITAQKEADIMAI
ncbi:MAG: ribosome recycling factor [Magnetococcales bacterium]|nr:ribosome recycling factor [Magnetococcales bacterium]